MKLDDIYFDVDRRHVMQLFDLICESDFDPFEMVEAYAKSYDRARADNHSNPFVAEYFILKQPGVTVMQLPSKYNIHNKAKDEIDQIIFHWMADMYLFALYELDIPFAHSVKIAPPRFLYDHYSPLHETSLQNAWNKIKILHDRQNPTK